MAEHDDALLDDDLASLPDINDEEYNLDINNDDDDDDDDATISSQESTSEQLRCEFKSSVEDILDLTDLDSFEELEKNIVVELENNSLHIAKIKQENINTVSSDEDNSRDQFNDEDISLDDVSKLSKDNCSSESSCKTIEPNRVEHQNIHINESEYQHINSIEKERDSHNYDRCLLNENHSRIQPIDQLCGPSFYQPYYNCQDQRLNLGLNNSSFFNERPMHEPYSRDCFSNQPVFFYNNNSYPNYGCHLPVTACLYHPSCQNSSFTNQALQQSIQMSHGHIPIMANTCQPILVDSNRQMIYNQNHIGPNYFDSTHRDQLIYKNQDQPQYVLNPLYNQNHFNKQKVLVNRHFSETQARRENWLYDEFDKTDRFLKKIGSLKRNRSRRSFSQSTNNMDPYSYFSDIWQAKNAYESRRFSPKRSISPEIISSTPNLKNQKRRFKNDANHQQERKRTKTSTMEGSWSFINEALHSRRKRRELENKFVKVQRNVEHKRTNTGRSKNTSTESRRKDIDSDIKEEEKIDPEMIEYCKKIEEQKRQRAKFLQEKEMRRKQLAMEKTGIKKEPFADEVV